MSVPHIAVSYNGGEKRVSLSVQPSLELSDSEVDNAAGELHKVLRNMFSVEANTAFYLHEVETGRVMSKESFREPKYCQTFPTHWYLVIDNYSTSNSTLLNADPFQVSAWVLVSYFACLSHCVRVCACACMRMYVHVCVHTLSLWSGLSAHW